MKAFKVLEKPVEHALGVYFHHCAITMTCRQLAMAGRYLAFSGKLPGKGVSVISSERARRINALMLPAAIMTVRRLCLPRGPAGQERRGRGHSGGGTGQGIHRCLVAGP